MTFTPHRPRLQRYVTAPASWFALDVLAGTALDALVGTLHLAPVVLPGAAYAQYPLLHPQMWANVVATVASKNVTVMITRAFTSPPIVISRVIAAPIGTSSADAAVITLPVPFVATEGAVLDLSDHWDALTGAKLSAPVLTNGPKPAPWA